METWWKTKKEKEDKDLTKLKGLLLKHKPSMYGCTVYLASVTSKDGEDFLAVNMEESKIRRYYACLPVK